MKIEIRLSKVLRDYGLDRNGLITWIATETGEQRGSIAKFLDDGFKNPSLATIGKLCDFLRREGVPPELLPYCLFGVRPSGVWAACAQKPRIVLYLGEYNEVDRPRPRYWVAKRDSAAANEISRILLESHDESDDESIDAGRPQDHDSKRPIPVILEEYVPFRFLADGATTLDDAAFQGDVSRSKNMLAELKKREQAVVLIGSMRVNYLVEHFMADLFKCEPFQADTGGHKIPIYMMHREDDVNAPSCFGGADPPSGISGKARPGIYYRGPDNKWNACPSMYKEEDVGIAVTAYNPGDASIAIAVFGYSGRATFGMKRYLREWGHRCLLPPAKGPEKSQSKGPRHSLARGPNGRLVGIHVFKMTFEEEPESEDNQSSTAKRSSKASKSPRLRKSAIREQSAQVKQCKIIALDECVVQNAIY